MSTKAGSGLLDQVPVLHVRGTYYDVGFSIGRTFASLIKEFLRNWKHLEDGLIPAYNSERGKKIYDDTLANCERKYPQYVTEMQGLSDGAGISFYKIFLLHIETLLEDNIEDDILRKKSTIGCTGIISNYDKILLGHTEDAPTEMLNRFFIVSAQIVDGHGGVMEDFSSLTYPGYLPGYTMGFNKYGLVYSVNTIFPVKTYGGGTPVYFIARAVLAAKSSDQVISILKDSGVGIADGITFNLIFLKNNDETEVVNIEVGPSPDATPESQINMQWVAKGSSLVHCNRYLRLEIPEVQGITFKSSCHRQVAIEKLPTPKTAEDIKRILSDRSDRNFPVYRILTEEQKLLEKMDRGMDYGSTIAVGLFDISERIWAIYTKPPATSEPVVVLPMNFAL